jgi:molybdopterin synthase catalytic subunit
MKSPTFRQSPEGDFRMTDIPQILIEICESPLDLNELNAKAQSGSGEIGASVVFTGNVRTATEADGLVAMTLEHYPGMTEHQLSKIVDNAISRWKLNRVLVSHRVGKLVAGDPIVYIAVAGLHRKECFEAAQFIMDYLKNDATFWKKEHFLKQREESDVWVKAKQTDIDSIKKWV